MQLCSKTLQLCRIAAAGACDIQDSCRHLQLCTYTRYTKKTTLVDRLFTGLQLKPQPCIPCSYVTEWLQLQAMAQNPYQLTTCSQPSPHCLSSRCCMAQGLQSALVAQLTNQSTAASALQPLPKTAGHMADRAMHKEHSSASTQQQTCRLLPGCVFVEIRQQGPT